MKRNGLIILMALVLAGILILFYIKVDEADGTTEEVINPVNIVIYKEIWGNLVTQDASIVRDEIEKQIKLQYGLDLTLDYRVFEGTEYGCSLDLVFSSGETIDAFVVGEDKLGLWYNRGKVAELNELLEEYGPNIKKIIPDEVWEQVSMNGRILAVPSFGEATGSCVLVRKDILDEYELEVPETIEGLETVSEKLLEADPDLIPITGAWWDFANLLCPALEISKWDAHIIDDENKMILTGNLQAEFHKYFQTLQNWRKLGYLDDDYLSSNFERMKQLFISGRTVFAFNHVERTHDWGLDILEINPDADVTVIPQLNGKGVWSGSGYVSQALVIPVSSKRKVEVIRYLDWIYSDQGNYLLTSLGIEGLHYEIVDEHYIHLGEVGYPGVYSLLFQKNLAIRPVDRSPFWQDAYDKVTSVNWEMDPLKGKVFLQDRPSDDKLNGLFSRRWGIFLSGEIDATRENYEEMLDWYFENGGESIAHDYYIQYINQMK